MAFLNFVNLHEVLESIEIIKLHFKATPFLAKVFDSLEFLFAILLLKLLAVCF
jgi:hypothetical protein